MNSEHERFVRRVLFSVGTTIGILLVLLLLWYVQQVIYLLFAGTLAAIFFRGTSVWISRKSDCP